MIGLVKSAALETASRGVTVNCISPGAVETDLAVNEPAFEWVVPEDRRESRGAYVELLNQQSPLPVPWNQPAEIAAAMVFLASDAAKNVSGTELVMSPGGVASNVV